MLKAEKAAANSSLKQTPISDFTVKQEKAIPYSEETFRQAALEWLIATDQPIQALEHLKFASMIGIASRAPDGVKLPSAKVTRSEIMQMFSDHLLDLRTRARERDEEPIHMRTTFQLFACTACALFSACERVVLCLEFGAFQIQYWNLSKAEVGRQ